MLCMDVIGATSVAILGALGNLGHIVTYLVLYFEV